MYGQLMIPPGFENIGASIAAANNKVEAMNETFNLSAAMMRATASDMAMEAQAIQDQADNQAQQTKDEAAGYLAQGLVTISGEAVSTAVETKISGMDKLQEDLKNPSSWSEAMNASKTAPQELMGIGDERARQKTAITQKFASEDGTGVITDDTVGDLANLKQLNLKAYNKLNDRINKTIETKENKISNLRQTRQRMGQKIDTLSQSFGALAQGGAKLQQSNDQAAGAVYAKEKAYADLLLDLAKGLYNELNAAANRMSNDINSMNQALISTTLQAGNAR